MDTSYLKENLNSSEPSNQFSSNLKNLFEFLVFLVDRNKYFNSSILIFNF